MSIDVQDVHEPGSEAHNSRSAATAAAAQCSILVTSKSAIRQSVTSFQQA
jgi:hypothetical protein